MKIKSSTLSMAIGASILMVMLGGCTVTSGGDAYLTNQHVERDPQTGECYETITARVEHQEFSVMSPTEKDKISVPCPPEHPENH